jgi:regulatory protein
MIVVSVKTGAETELRRVELSDGSFFLLRTCYLSGRSSGGAGCFAEGEEISAAGEEALHFAAACFRAERAALRLVARAEQTARGLSHKLEHRGFDAACVQAVIRRLGDLGAVDDRRFAGLWVQSRLARRTESPRRLLAGLRGRGIGRDDAEMALRSALDFQNESALLRGYIEKFHLVPGAEGGGSSLKHRLKGEGFSSAVIQDCWEEREW